MSLESLSSTWFYRFQIRSSGVSSWLTLVLSALLGCSLAILIVLYPLPGMGAPLAVLATIVFVRQPQFLLLFFFVSLAIPIQRSIGGLPLNASDGLLMLWCVLWPIMMLRQDGPTRENWRLPELVSLITPFVVAVLIAQLNSINPSSSIKQVLRIAEWFVVLPLLMSTLVPNPGFRKFAGLMLMVVPCLFAIDGIYEYFSNGQTITGILGISVPTPEGDHSQIRHTFDVSGRAGSSFGGAQGLAMYLVMTISFSIAHLFYAAERWMRRLAFFSILISMGGLAVAQSRGGFVGGVAVLLTLILVTRPRLRAPVICTVLFLAAIALGVLGIWPDWDGTLSGLIPGRPEAVLDRLIIWEVVGEVFLSNPFFGVGLGNFRDAFFANAAWLHVDLAYPSLHAHSTYLEILADTGAFGILGYLAFLFLVARRLLGIWRSGVNQVLTLASIGSLAAYSVFAAVDMLLLQNMHFLLILVLSVGMYRGDSPAVGVMAQPMQGELK
jgi:O-antigen ligase